MRKILFLFLLTNNNNIIRDVKRLCIIFKRLRNIVNLDMLCKEQVSKYIYASFKKYRIHNSVLTLFA